jgi:hypothetical protein
LPYRDPRIGHAGGSRRDEALGLAESDDDHRCVLAVVRYLMG